MWRELAETEAPNFPFKAVMRGEVVNYRRIDTPVKVLRRSGMERHYYIVETDYGRKYVCNDSMLYLEE
jgi:hypothetical protein